MNTRLLMTILAFALNLGCAIETANTEDTELGIEDIGVVQEDVTGPGSIEDYTPALVRLDWQGGGSCSAVLVGPNLLVTAAHCVSDRTIDGITNWNGMRYGMVRVRMVYKPSATEVMCLNETCRNSDGSTRYSTVFAFWDDAYVGDGDWPSDMAVLTRVTRADFLTRPGDPGEPAPRNLNAGDFMRILNVSLPTSGEDWYMRVAGYGAPSDGASTANPRHGPMQVYDWNSYTMVANYNSGEFWAAACLGDSGGPISVTPSPGGTTYVGGITVGSNDGISGSCPEPGDDIVFNRMSAKVWMLDRIRQWIEGADCLRFSTSALPGSGEYFRCW